MVHQFAAARPAALPANVVPLPAAATSTPPTAVPLPTALSEAASAFVAAAASGFVTTEDHAPVPPHATLVGGCAEDALLVGGGNGFAHEETVISRNTTARGFSGRRGTFFAPVPI